MMSDAVLTALLGRAPTPQDRAIHADQTARLAAIRFNPLLPDTDGLQRQQPFPTDTA